MGARSTGDQALATTADILYIMQNSRIPDEYKIGRTSNVEQRRLQLGMCMNFEMVVLATFPLWGHMETDIKRMLEPRRVKMGLPFHSHSHKLASVHCFAPLCFLDSGCI